MLPRKRLLPALHLFDICWEGNYNQCIVSVYISTNFSALQISAKSFSTVFVASSAAFLNSYSSSSTLNVSLFLYLAAIEAIADMQYHIREASKSPSPNNDDIWWAIFIHHHSRKLVRKYSLCNLWNIYCEEYICSHFTENGRIEGNKSNTESDKNLTIWKSRGSQRASRFIDVSNGESNFSAEKEAKPGRDSRPPRQVTLRRVKNSKRET